MQVCNLCEKKIVVSNDLTALKENLSCPGLCAICEPTFTEQQVIDGVCCLSCYELSINFSLKEKFTIYCEECDSEIQIIFDDKDAIFDFRNKILCLDCETKRFKEKMAKEKVLSTQMPCCEIPF